IEPAFDQRTRGRGTPPPFFHGRRIAGSGWDSRVARSPRKEHMNRMTIPNESATDQRATRRVLSASTLTGDAVVNSAEEDLGKIHDLMIDLPTGKIAYAVLSFGGVLGIADKLFAVPWNALTVDQQNRRFMLDVSKDTLERAPGFPKDHWPDMS